MTADRSPQELALDRLRARYLALIVRGETDTAAGRQLAADIDVAQARRYRAARLGAQPPPEATP